MSQWSQRRRQCYQRWVAGWVYGVGIRGGYTGGYTGEYPAARGGPNPAKRAPEALQGLEWVGLGPGVTGDGGGNGHIPTLRARSGSESPPWDMPSECRLTAKRARIHQYFSKVSQNRKVSPKKCEKACHSPYIPKRVSKVSS